MDVVTNGDVAVGEFHCRVPAIAPRLIQLRHALTDWATRLGMPVQTIEDVVLATYEATANVVEHAYRDGVGGLLDLCAHADHVRGIVTVTVIDYGCWRPRPSPADHGSHGRGLSLIHRLAERAEIRPSERGTTVTMTYHMA